MCSSLRNAKQMAYEQTYKVSYVTEITDTTVIPDGVYSTTNGFRYEVINGQWFRLQAFGQKQAVSVEQAVSQGAVIYKLGGIWYRFNNNKLHVTTYVRPINSITWDTINYRDFGYAESGVYNIGTSQYSLFVNNGFPMWSRFNADGTSTDIQVEDKHWMNVWYYKFGETWYRLDLGTKVFKAIGSLPWENIKPIEKTEVTVIQANPWAMSETYQVDTKATAGWQ